MCGGAGVEVADGLLTVDQKKKESWGQLVNVFSLQRHCSGTAAKGQASTLAIGNRQGLTPKFCGEVSDLNAKLCSR